MVESITEQYLPHRKALRALLAAPADGAPAGGNQPDGAAHSPFQIGEATTLDEFEAAVQAACAAVATRGEAPPPPPPPRWALATYLADAIERRIADRADEARRAERRGERRASPSRSAERDGGGGGDGDGDEGSGKKEKRKRSHKSERDKSERDDDDGRHHKRKHKRRHKDGERGGEEGEPYKEGEHRDEPPSDADAAAAILAEAAPNP